MQNIAILASHNGSGLDAIHNAIVNKELDLSISLVISNNQNAKALQKAKNYNLNSFLVNSKSDENVDEKIRTLLKEHNCKYVFLSGYMKMLSPILTNNFIVINSHPSLLPKHGGAGMYGRFVHESVILNKDTTSGVTIHLVNKAYDDGEIILQKELILSPDENVDSLERKIKELEKFTIVEALALYIK